MNYSNCIVHHGVKGQRWGVRRYQNEDGSLTNAGKKKISNRQNADVSKVDKKKKIAKAIGISSATVLSTVAAGVAVHKGAQWISDSLGKAMLNAAWDQVISDANAFDSFIR